MGTELCDERAVSRDRTRHFPAVFLNRRHKIQQTLLCAA
jgi:hypothetical protein